MANPNDDQFCRLCEKWRDAIFYAIMGADAAGDEARAAELEASHKNVHCAHMDHNDFRRKA